MHSLSLISTVVYQNSRTLLIRTTSTKYHMAYRIAAFLMTYCNHFQVRLVEHLLNIWQYINWHSASRGPSAVWASCYIVKSHSDIISWYMQTLPMLYTCLNFCRILDFSLTNRPTSVLWDWRISRHADPTSTRRVISRKAHLWRLRRRISTAMITCGWAWPARWPICPIFGFWGKQSSQKCVIPCLGRRWTAVQN